MTIEAAKLLDDAWELYYKVASQPDSSSICWQTPASQPPSTPYDYAAGLCRSLLPYVYGYKNQTKAQQEQITDNIWINMVNQLQVLTMEAAQKFTHICDTCGHTTSSYAHYCECDKPRIEAEAVEKYCPRPGTSNHNAEHPRLDAAKPQHGGDGPW